jgi:sugar phosphate isomerase/epimerase
MKLGAYTACLHDKPVAEALQTLRDLGLDSAEINSGGFLPAPHLPIEQVRASQDAREEYLGLFDATGVTLTALNCNGNPLHADPEVRDKHGNDVREAISLAALLGVKRVVTMSGLPAADPGGRLPSWTVLPWDSAYLDARDYQWQEVAIPYWKDIQARARDADVKVCIEMHPHNLVYNPSPPWTGWAVWCTTRRPRTPASTRPPR